MLVPCIHIYMQRILLHVLSHHFCKHAGVGAGVCVIVITYCTVYYYIIMLVRLSVHDAYMRICLCSTIMIIHAYILSV